MEARKEVDRELHAVVVQSTAHLARVPDRMTYDLRCGQRRVYGTLLTFIDRRIADGTPEKLLQVIPAVLAVYIHDQCRDSAPDDPRTPPC